jgi:DNA-binding HxlR family transcriptional regulator
MESCKDIVYLDMVLVKRFAEFGKRYPERLAAILQIANDFVDESFFFTEMQRRMPWLSYEQLRNALNDLVRMGYLVTAKRKDHPFDQMLVYKLKKEKNDV